MVEGVDFDILFYRKVPIQAAFDCDVSVHYCIGNCAFFDGFIEEKNFAAALGFYPHAGHTPVFILNNSARQISVFLFFIHAGFHVFRITQRLLRFKFPKTVAVTISRMLL